MNQLLASIAYTNKKSGIMYTDLIGNIPVRSIDGYTAFFIRYDWTTSAILATLIKYASNESMVAAFKENIEYLAERGFRPVFNVTDNVALKEIRAYTKEAKVGLQLVQPNNHRANAVERAI